MCISDMTITSFCESPPGEVAVFPFVLLVPLVCGGLVAAGDMPPKQTSFVPPNAQTL